MTLIRLFTFFKKWVARVVTWKISFSYWSKNLINRICFFSAHTKHVYWTFQEFSGKVISGVEKICPRNPRKYFYPENYPHYSMSFVNYEMAAYPPGGMSTAFLNRILLTSLYYLIVSLDANSSLNDKSWKHLIRIIILILLI